MRKIKFRAWDNHHAEMIRVDAIALERNCFSTNDYIYGSQPHFYDEHNDLHLLDECELMQFIGIEDKNGTEIYEGDIVRHYNMPQFPDVYKVAVVRYEDKRASFRKKNIGEDKTFAFGQGIHYEVIGNIHENPELLQKI